MKHAVLLSLFLIACGPPPVIEPDSGIHDAGLADAGSGDAGVIDSGTPDAGQPDAGAPDAGRPDAGPPDAGPPDAGMPDAGRPDAGPTGCPVATDAGAPFRLRAMAANLTSGNNQSYDPGHGARIMQGVDPDVVMIQEFNYGDDSSTAMTEFVSNTFESTFQWTRGVGNIPNGIISRWPIVASGEWNGQAPDRELTWAKVDLPGPADLLVISVHFLTSSSGDRNLDARTIMGQLDAGVSPYDYVLLGGDFNTNSRTEACFSTLSPRFKTTAPFPVDQNNNGNTNAGRSSPYDHVLASTCLAQRQVPTVLQTSTYDAGVVIDTRVYTPLSDIAPALSSDSNANNMQHMGVVKDFWLTP